MADAPLGTPLFVSLAPAEGVKVAGLLATFTDPNSTAKPGDLVETGEPLASVYARDRAGIERGRAALRSAIAIADEVEPPLPLVSHRVTKSGVEEMA